MAAPAPWNTDVSAQSGASTLRTTQTVPSGEANGVATMSSHVSSLAEAGPNHRRQRLPSRGARKPAQHCQQGPPADHHQQSGECIFLHILHITFMLTYLAYFCIFCAYKCIWMHRRNTYGVTAYFCIFCAYLCIFKFAYNGIFILVHISAYYAYLCI